MSQPSLTYELRDAAAWITLDRPHAMNALSRELRTEIPRAIARAGEDEAARVVVITGRGDRAFSAGADITEFNGPQAPSANETRGSDIRWHEAPSRCPKPVIAAVNGVCLGGGLELALGCDIRVCARRASFALPEVGVGVIPGAGGTQRLARTIGLGPALAMILTAQRVSAEDALRLGLVTEVFDDGQLADGAQQLATRIAGHGALALEAAKAAVYRGLDGSLEGGLAIEAELDARVLGSDEQIERAAAFTNRKRR